MNKEKSFVSAVVYIHNDGNRVKDFLGLLVGVLENNFEHSEIICVNDFSTDNGPALIREVANTAKTTTVSVLNMSYFHGKEMAMNAGIDLAIGDFVFEFDYTLVDFDESLIMDVYRKSLEGFDIVSASPNRKMSLYSKVFYKMYDHFTKVSSGLNAETFRILSRRVINRIDAMNKTTPYRKAVYAACGLKTTVLKYDVLPIVVKRKTPKIEKKYNRGLAIDSLILFTNVGYTFSKFMTVLMMLSTIAMTLYVILVNIASNPIEGWTTTILFLSFVFFGLFAVLTVIIKYLQIIVDLVFKRKTYSFESIEKLTK
jgi:dolichol-phosphate mannosyltransferase